MKQTQDDEAKKVDRRMLGVAAGTFALALCVFGGFYTQRNAAQSQAAQLRYLQPPQRVLSPEMRAQYAERAKLLRAKMEPWARRHQAQIRRMRAAGPDDAAALEAVWQVVPEGPDLEGITLQDMMPSHDPLIGVGFGWSGFAKVSTRTKTPDQRAKPDSQKMMQKIDGMAKGRLHNNFKEHRDVALMIGAKNGTWTWVWASGRITQATDLPRDEAGEVQIRFQREGRPWRESDLQGPIEEVAPAYDFLTSSTTS